MPRRSVREKGRRCGQLPPDDGFGLHESKATQGCRRLRTIPSECGVLRAKEGDREIRFAFRKFFGFRVVNSFLPPQKVR